MNSYNVTIYGNSKVNYPVIQAIRGKTAIFRALRDYEMVVKERDLKDLPVGSEIVIYIKRL
jgi:hypothetical protein